MYKNLPMYNNGERAVYTILEEPVDDYETKYLNHQFEAVDYAANGYTINNIRLPRTGDNTPHCAAGQRSICCCMRIGYYDAQAQLMHPTIGSI